MPVLKVDPNSGESLDKAKSVEQAKAEEEARIKALAEFKERVKAKKPRKKKEVELEEVLATPAITIVKKDIPVKVNPFLAPNGEINPDELLGPLNIILGQVEDTLRLITKGYKLSNSNTDLFSQLELPKAFEYKSSVTRVTSGEDAFDLTKPSGLTTLTYEKFYKDIYVDRVFLKPIDVKELLKSDKAYEILKTLIIDGMWQNLWNVKELDSKKKYFGTQVGTIRRPGPDAGYCSANTAYDEAMIEIRLYSDITLLPEGVKDERIGKSVKASKGN